MSNLRKAAEQALYALEDIGDEYGFTSKRTLPKRTDAVIALRAALAEPDNAELREALEQMKPLDADMAAILNANLDSLYITDEPAAALAEPDEEIARLEDRIDWLENGLAEWRDMALSNARQAKAVRATARVAIRHLKAVLAECAYDPVRADMEAQDWLVSIGDDVEEKK